jgi:hypothetical protein
MCGCCGPDGTLWLNHPGDVLLIDGQFLRLLAITPQPREKGRLFLVLRAPTGKQQVRIYERDRPITVRRVTDT